MRAHGITKMQQDAWKATDGVKVLRVSASAPVFARFLIFQLFFFVFCKIRFLQFALLHKFMQHAELRAELLATDDKLLVQTYAGDDVMATGCSKEDFSAWTVERDGSTVTVRLP